MVLLNTTDQNSIQKLLSRRRIYLAIFFCFAVTAALFYFETKDQSFDFSHLNITGLSVVFLLCAVLMMVFRDLAYMVRIRLLTDKKLTWKQAFNVILLWEFASCLTPGVVGGSAVAMFILRKEKIPLGKSTALVIITAIMDNLFYIIAIPILMLVISSSTLLPTDSTWIGESGMSFFWLGYMMIFSVNLILILGVFVFPKAISFLIKSLFLLPFLRKKKSAGAQIGNDLITASKELKGKPFLYWFKIFAATCWSWTSRFLVINFVLLAFIEIGLFDQLVVLGRQLVMWLLMLIPLTPGSSGMAEFLFTDFLGDLIKNGTMAIVLAFIWRLISYYPYLIIGSILLPRWLRK